MKKPWRRDPPAKRPISPSSIMNANRKTEIQSILTSIVLSDQNVQNPSLISDYFHVLKNAFDNIIRQPKVGIYRKIDGNKSLFQNYILAVKGGPNVLLAVGFRKGEDENYIFEQSTTETLKLASDMVGEALARIPLTEQELPPAFIPFSRKISSYPMPPKPVIKTAPREALIQSMKVQELVDAKGKGVSILKDLETKIMMSAQEAENARLKSEADRQALERKAKEENDKLEAEKARHAAEVVRQKEIEERFERMRKDHEAAMKLQREEEEMQKKRYTEAKARRKANEKKRLESLSRKFTIGDEVVIQNLTGARHLNAKEGKVADVFNSNYRWPVMLEMGNGVKRLFNFKTENLRAKTYEMTRAELDTMARLMEMGFDEASSRAASMKTKGNVGKAMELLIGGRT
ncbi:hypothetical protein AAMO2058_000837600 [Amorphochlora amoebiformis]